MKILFIHNRYQYKGGEDTVLEMERSLLDSKGHQTKLLEFSNDDIGSMGSRISAGLRSFYNPISARRLKEEIISFAPDVIHVHNLFFNASPSVLYQAAKMQVPLVMTIHNYRFICANALLLRNNQVCELCINKVFPLEGIRYKCYRGSSVESALVTGITGVHKTLHSLNKKVHQIIAVSGFLKNKLIHSSLKYPGENIIVKPNFIHDTVKTAQSREDFFLFVGRLSIEKGIHLLLECFKRHPDMKLIIAGDGPEKESVLEAAKQFPSISYRGLLPKEKILTLMQTTKCLIFPSIWYEGLPLTIIEAFSAGTPVIASRLGAMSEMIIHDYNGLHFNPGDVKDLENCLEMFTRSERKDLYTQARKTYEDVYHPDIHYASVMGIYEKVINSKIGYV